MVPVSAAGATLKIRDGEVAVLGVSTESTNMVTPRRATDSIWRLGASGSVRYHGCAALMRSSECSMIVFCACLREATAGVLSSSILRMVQSPFLAGAAPLAGPNRAVRGRRAAGPRGWGSAGRMRARRRAS